jgi:hypothetical protein
VDNAHLFLLFFFIILYSNSPLSIGFIILSDNVYKTKHTVYYLVTNKIILLIIDKYFFVLESVLDKKKKDIRFFTTTITINICIFFLKTESNKKKIVFTETHINK